MTNRLTPIIAQKQREVAALKADVAASKDHILRPLLRGQGSRVSKKSFKSALQGPNLAVIAEIKRKSPSKGHLATIADPIALAQHYIASGASALSILTDEVFFNGSMVDLSSVASACVKQPTPILRKDFILDPIQIAQAAVAGADAILAIVAVLGEKTTTIVQAARDMGMVLDDLATLATGNAERDYVLFDHINPGSGQTFAWDKLNYRGPYAVGIAGGVRASNAGVVMARFQPAWIDVSSGVERTPGEKDVELIKRLVTTVKPKEC